MARIAGIERETLDVDVAIVGAGPAGLAAALRLAQCAHEGKRALRIAVFEKGASVGAQILSGAVFDARALDELLPDWRGRGAPVCQDVVSEEFLVLTRGGIWSVPAGLRPRALDHGGDHIISLGALWRWLGEQAEAAGVELYPGFAADTLLFGDQGQVIGIGIGDKGIGRDGQARANFAPGVDILARYTLLAEGARGHLGRTAIERFALGRGRAAQTYALGLKELWRVTPERHRPGHVIHSVGWPLSAGTYGGDFCITVLSAGLLSGWSLAWATPTRHSIRLPSCSGSRRTRRCETPSPAASAWAMARGCWSKAGCNRCRGSIFPAER